MNPTQTGIAVAVALVVVLVVFIFPGLSPFKASTQINTQNTSTTMPTETQLQMTDEIAGTGATAVAGDIVMVNYIGSFTNGAVFDSNKDANGFTFALGAGQV